MHFPQKLWVSVWRKIEIRAGTILLSRLKGAIGGPITEKSKRAVEIAHKKNKNFTCLLLL